MSAYLTVLRKECIDNFRDRRTILSSFSLAVLGPAFFVGLMSFVLSSALGESDEPLVITIAGANYAPELVEFLRRENTTIAIKEIEHPAQALRDGLEKLILVIPPEYGDRYTRGEVNSLSLVYDSSEFGRSQRNFSRARSMVNRYSATVGLLRLVLRGIDPSVARPIVIQEVDTASPAARALTILAMFPYFLVLVIFMGGFYLAIDTTAGEREHGSLEPLLTQPISRAALVMGKLTATCVFSALSLLLFLVSFVLAVPFVPLERIGMSLQIGLLDCIAVFLIAVPLIVFAAGLLAVVASFAKSYKEAQTYLTIVILVPTFPLILTRLMNVETSIWLMLVPSLSQANLISDVIAGQAVFATHIGLSALVTSGLAVAMTYLAIWLYKRETILI
ncbi:MAG: ABC transporter permease [Gammaproteobacteria bacterium]|nr:ABC transporter permease [Gammaproteobacteria bacterium]